MRSPSILGAGCVALFALSCASSTTSTPAPATPAPAAPAPAVPIGEGAGTPASQPADDDLPEQLKPSDIQRSMGRIKARVQWCYDRYQVPGMVQITLTIEPVGRV